MLYEWLRDYQKLLEEIEYLEFSIERNEIELKRWVEGDLQDVRLTEESNGAKLEEIIERQVKGLVFKRDQLDKLIDLVDKFRGLDNKILKLKYIDGMTLETIAEELNYSASYIYKKHAEMMKTLKFVDSLNLHFIDSNL